MRMDAIKDSHEGPISYGILSAIGATPPAVEDRLIGFFTQKASAVVTNVPGPREQVYFAGTPGRGRARLGAVLGQHRDDREHLQLHGRGHRRLHDGHGPRARPAAAGGRLRRRAARPMPRHPDARLAGPERQRDGRIGLGGQLQQVR